MSLEEIEQEICRDGWESEIACHFQPIVDRQGGIAAFEVLARWYHPEYGLIPSPAFIAVAEQSGSIVALGKRMLFEACRICRTWNRDGGYIGVAVNLSAVQLVHENLPEVVCRSLEVSGLDPDLLTLELTETALVRDMEFASRQLTRLHDLGVRIALDDFGTGYSSLAYLASLPADTIKLDRRFIHNDSARSAIVVQGIVELAHKLDLQVVAEGVETEAQARRFLDLGCDQMQGRYVGAPQPLEQVLQLIADLRAPTP